jgi:hypothetical protein
MKNIYSLFSVSVLLFSMLGCENEFDEINTNKVDPTSESINPVFLLNNAIIGLSFPSFSNIIYEVGIVQQIISPNSGVIAGANFNQDNRTATVDQWNDYYENVIKHTGEILGQLGENPERSNLLQMTRIIEAYAFMVLTDDYGDIPYFEAGKGFSDQIAFPKYDAQQDIYTDIIKELTEATAALSESAPAETGEVLYSGDLNKWRRLGNSLLLRAGMRLVNVDGALAQQTVQAAVAGGVLQSNDDNFVVRHDNNFTNPYGGLFNGTEANNFYLTANFVDFLFNTNDPRLTSMAIRYVGANSGPEQTLDRSSKDPADQIGMPMGHDNASIAGVASDMGLASFFDFTQLDRFTYGSQTAPMFLLTYAQTQLLLAEAATRGWVGGSAASFYEAGVRAHMEQLTNYGGIAAIPTADIDTYLANNPFDVANALEQINTQYWVVSLLNGPEAFANFRRSGFPTLAPNPFPGQDISGDFINRLTYPTSEIAVNKANLDAAVARMGPDNLDTKVWWDVD